MSRGRTAHLGPSLKFDQFLLAISVISPATCHNFEALLDGERAVRQMSPNIAHLHSEALRKDLPRYRFVIHDRVGHDSRVI